MVERDIFHTDILIIGGGPGGLATAIHLADLIREHNKKTSGESGKEPSLPCNILLLDKGSAIGSHTLSGAVVKPAVFKDLLPDLKEEEFPFDSLVTSDEVRFFTKRNTFKFPFTLPFMSNKNNHVACLGKITRWLAKIAEEKGVQIYPGFTGYEMLYKNNRVVGVRTGDSGIDKKGEPVANYQPGTDIFAKIVILAEGARGHLIKELKNKFNLSEGRNPQVYSLGVKELWEVPEGVFQAGRVIHSLGYPLNSKQFGGAFMYGLSGNRVAIGLAAGLDSEDPTFDFHHAFQIYKKHPFVANILKNGKLIHYGAKTIPEGGFFSIPQLYHHGFMLVGDTAGLLSMPSLKGIHLAVQLGMFSAKSALEALKNDDYSQNQLSLYEKLFKNSQIYRELYRFRNFRQAFEKGVLRGAICFMIQMLTFGRGLVLSGKRTIREDRKHCKELSHFKGKTFQEKFKNEIAFDKQLTFDKATNVFYSGTHHDEHQRTHCIIPNPDLCRDVCIPKYGAPCQHFCPAEVYELVKDPKTCKEKISIHAENCVHCKTCDIKDPFRNIVWTPPYGGDGPEYETM